MYVILKLLFVTNWPKKLETSVPKPTQLSAYTPPRQGNKEAGGSTRKLCTEYVGRVSIATAGEQNAGSGSNSTWSGSLVALATVKNNKVAQKNQLKFPSG